MDSVTEGDAREEDVVWANPKEAATPVESTQRVNIIEEGAVRGNNRGRLYYRNGESRGT